MAAGTIILVAFAAISAVAVLGYIIWLIFSGAGSSDDASYGDA